MSLVLRLAILVWAATGLSLRAENTPEFTFYGQVLADEPAPSSTNAIPTVVHKRVARIRIEYVKYYDQPIPLRIPDEVSVYYYSHQGWATPRPVGLADGQRRTFACDRYDVPGRTNVWFAFHITP